MEYNNKIFWDEALKRLLEKYEDTVRAFFQKVEYLRTDENSVVISLPSQFVKSSLEERGLLREVEEYFNEASGLDLRVKTEIHKAKVSVSPSSQEKVKDGDIRKERKPHPKLNPRYTFENFVSGKNNEQALGASQGIADVKNFGVRFNPYFIHGGVGLGKTHLMHSIGHRVYEKFPDKNIICVTAEEFVNDFTGSLKSSSIDDFKRKYRKTDLLLIDDVQWLSGKSGTQEELFNTFETLFEGGKQMVFTSDRPPTQFKDFMARLTSRFSSGLVLDIQPPNFEVRRAIALKKLESMENGELISGKVVDFISQQINSNIRDMEGALNRVAFNAGMVGRVISLEEARKELQDFLKEVDKIQYASEQKIIDAVCEFFAISPEELMSKSRAQRIAIPRHYAIYLMRAKTELSTTEIGRIFKRDHSTILHSEKTINNLREVEPSTERIITDIMRIVENLS